jgi:endonuclease/exonuclease/phosphatase family metal-dependent hydrolase
MKFIIANLLLLLSFSAFSAEIKIMSFNTMCDFCTGKEYESFSKRKPTIKKIIEKHAADLISLQEVRSGSQVREFFKDKPNYELHFTENFLFSYADPALAVNTDRFEVISKGSHWLGPNNGKLSFGWKAALPRQVIWLKLKDKISQKEFIFSGSHFDNRIENMIGSAKFINKFTKESKVPVIFAADTNSTPDFKGYQILKGEEFYNSYDLMKSKRKIASSEHKDLCYYRKGDLFPDCRVDHILLSKHINWKVKDWKIDTTTYGDNKFPSDHRPVITTVSFTNDQ